MITIGIDPGKGGGIAVLDDERDPAACACKMPETERDLWDFICAQNPSVVGRIHAFVEKVQAAPAPVRDAAGDVQGFARMGAKSAFTFGQGYGSIRMALVAAGIPFEEVSPIRWQTAMACRTRGDKNVSKARAQQLFPGLKITHAIADALLIAEYGRRLRAPQKTEVPF